MARNEITFQVNLRKNENTTSRAYGLYYFEAEKKEPLSLKGFARHMAEHGKLATYQERTPLATYAIAHAEADPEP